MDNSILAGIYIRKIMIENEELMNLIPANKIFPLLANPDTTFPFILYQRTNLIADYCKDGTCDNKATFTIIIVSNKHSESVYIANAVRHALENYRYIDDDISIDPIHLDSIYEETLDDAYIQRMVFSFYVQ